MKNLIFILFILVGFSSCSKSHIVISESELPEEVFYLPDQVKPFTGVCVIYFYDSEVVKEEMNFKKGILNGNFTSYHKDGTVKLRGTYIGGQMHGKWEAWYQNGIKRYIANFENDSLNGEYCEWYNTGVIKEKGLYALNNRIGEWIEYDEAGMITKKSKI